MLQENKFLKGDVSGSNADNNRAYCVVTLGPDLICRYMIQSSQNNYTAFQIKITSVL